MIKGYAKYIRGEAVHPIRQSIGYSDYALGIEEKSSKGDEDSRRTTRKPSRKRTAKRKRDKD